MTTAMSLKWFWYSPFSLMGYMGEGSLLPLPRFSITMIKHLTKSERRERTKKRRSANHRIHSRSLGQIYKQEIKKREGAQNERLYDPTQHPNRRA